MTKQFVIATVLGLGFTTNAAADDKADAQKKVDAAKTETCEKTKKFLADQAAKGRCKDESAAAQKVTCSASTFKEMTDLNTKCVKAPAAKDSKGTKDAKDAKTDEAKPAGAPKCHAMVDGKAIAEVEEASSVSCSVKLMDAVRAVKCTTPDMKGKKVEYTIHHDHKVANKPLKDRATSLTCTRITPAK